MQLGQRLGPSQILALEGAGGMGDLYRARDTRLNREVAIKVLPERVAFQPESLARLSREAQSLASLNHPNIAAIYGVEEQEGLHALVLELVEGPTLADRIAQGRLRLDAAIATARQMAFALDAAHEQGIIHRDLKPSNIKLRPDGAVKVLDFGLAKALERPLEGADVVRAPPMDRPWSRRRHGCLHEPRADTRQRRGQAHGHLGIRMRAVRDADRAESVRP